MLITDKNFHKVGRRWVPRVTAITGMWPHGYGLLDFYGKAASTEDAERMARKAAELGSRVHWGAERLINGAELRFEEFSEEEWVRLEGLANFWEKHQPEPVAVETFLFSRRLGTAGTPDLVARIEGKTVLVDWKSGNSNQYYNYELQAWVYRTMWDAERPDAAIDECWIVQLGGKTKQRFSVKVVKTDPKCLERDFRLCKRLFEHERGTEPSNREYRDKLKLRA